MRVSARLKVTSRSEVGIMAMLALGTFHLLFFFIFFYSQRGGVIPPPRKSASVASIGRKLSLNLIKFFSKEISPKRKFPALHCANARHHALPQSGRCARHGGMVSIYSHRCANNWRVVRFTIKNNFLACVSISKGDCERASIFNGILLCQGSR